MQKKKFLKKMKLRAYWSFPSKFKFIEVKNFLRNYLAKEVEQNFMKHSFLVNKKIKYNLWNKT